MSRTRSTWGRCHPRRRANSDLVTPSAPMRWWSSTLTAVSVGSGAQAAPAEGVGMGSPRLIRAVIASSSASAAGSCDLRAAQSDARCLLCASRMCSPASSASAATRQHSLVHVTQRKCCAESGWSCQSRTGKAQRVVRAATTRALEKPGCAAARQTLIRCIRRNVHRNGGISSRSGAWTSRTSWARRSTSI